jgi:hypothetical protein
MSDAGLPVSLLETRQVRDAFRSMPVKTDCNDPRGIAQLMGLGWFRRVHCKLQAMQENRALLTGRKMLQLRYIDIRMCPCGLSLASGSSGSTSSSTRTAKSSRRDACSIGRGRGLISRPKAHF